MPNPGRTDTKTLYIRLSDEQAAWLADQMEADYRSKADLVRSALRLYAAVRLYERRGERLLVQDAKGLRELVVL